MIRETWRLELMTWGVALVAWLRPRSEGAAGFVALLLARTTNTRSLLHYVEREKAAGRLPMPDRALVATLLYALAADLGELQEERGAIVMETLGARYVGESELLDAIHTLADEVNLPSARLLLEVEEYLTRVRPELRYDNLPRHSFEPLGVLLERLGLEHLADPPEPKNPFDESAGAP